MLTAKLGTQPTTSPIDLQPPPLVSPAIQNTMSPKPSTIQRIQSFFRHTPRKIFLSIKLDIIPFFKFYFTYQHQIVLLIN